MFTEKNEVTTMSNSPEPARQSAGAEGGPDRGDGGADQSVITKTHETVEEYATEQLFEMTWRAKWLADGAKTIEQMAEALEAEAAHLRELAAISVELADVVEDDYAFLNTTDPEVAAKYEFEPVGHDTEEEEDVRAMVVGVGPADKLGSGLAADLAAVWAVDGKVGILGHAESTEFVRPEVTERFNNASRKAV